MNVLELLKQEHEKVASLFESAERSGDGMQKQQLFSQIRAELEMHTKIEEGIFYPALEQHDGLRNLVAEAYEKHQQVKTLLHETTAVTDEVLRELKENVEHHVEEEETQMFPRVREVMSASELEQIGMAMEQMRTQSRAART